MQANPDVDALEIVELEDYESLMSFHDLEGEASVMCALASCFSLCRVSSLS